MGLLDLLERFKYSFSLAQFWDTRSGYKAVYSLASIRKLEIDILTRACSLRPGPWHALGAISIGEPRAHIAEAFMSRSQSETHFSSRCNPDRHFFYRRQVLFKFSQKTMSASVWLRWNCHARLVCSQLGEEKYLKLVSQSAAAEKNKSTFS
jgi:hypothetical protein